MIEALKGWIISVVTTVIFITIIEIILPSGSIKKYVKLATGLLIMLVILSPIFKLINNSSSLEEQILSYSSSIADYKEVDTKKAQEEFKEKTKETLVAGLKKSICDEIKNKTGKEYTVTSIELSKAKNDFDFDGIKSITLKKSVGKDEVVTVDKIEIGETSEKGVEREEDVLRVLKSDFNVKDTEVKFIK